jgi:4-amino-4-deoxy-L-arabinose transferase-like glycosyltransferase
LLAYLPFLWSRVLFPGSAAGTPRAANSVRNWLILLALPAILLYPCLSFHLFEPDEGRYAEIPREMLLRGEWIVPYLQGEPYLDKPPMLYWLVGLSYRLFGVEVWAARLVTALAVHGCVLLTYSFGRRCLGARGAICGALLLMLAPGFVSIGRLLVMDSLLTLWVTLSLFSGFEALRGPRLRWGWWLLAAAGCGLGILTKGPVAVLLFAPPLWAYRRLSGASCRIPWPAVLVFAVLGLCLVLPWYVAICLRLPGFARYFLWQHNVVRFVAPFDHQRPVWFYGPILLLGLIPGTFLAIPFLRYLLSTRPEVARERGPELGFVLLAGVWCVLFFSLAGSKLPTYIMPAFPVLALALGYYLAHRRWGQTIWPAAVGVLFFLLLCFGHHGALRWYTNLRAPYRHVEALKRYCADPQTPVVCYSRNCDSVAFYVGRDDLQSFRSKQTHLLLYFCQQRPRTVVLFTHRHSLEGLRHALTPDLRLVEELHFGLGELQGLPDGLADKVNWLMGETTLGLCDVAVIEQRSLPARPGG